MKSEELFFEDLNFFRFFSLQLQKNAPLFHLFFFTFFASFFLFVWDAPTTPTTKKDDFFESSSSVKNYPNCLSLSSHFSFTHQ